MTLSHSNQNENINFNQTNKNIKLDYIESKIL